MNLNTKLHVASDLALPLDAVTQTFVIVGVRGSGKSTTAVLMAEAMLSARQQIIVLDPTDTWWGLRAGRDGTGVGFPITVLGGRHEDVPLEPAAGEVIADLVVDEHVSCVLSLKQFSDADKARFVTTFAARLYKRNRDPIHLFFDEAQLFAPQVPMKGEEMMLGLVKRLVMQGRTGGIGASFITQRPAVLNKNVMTQCETLIAMRVVGKHDRDAVEAWVDAWAETAEQQKEFEAALPGLETGTGFVWSPAWLKLFRRVEFPLPQTFDSRRTPKAGETRRDPKVLADVDLAKLRERMAATIERAKADDPRELRAEITRMKKQLAGAGRTAPDPAAIEKAVAAALDKERRQFAARLRGISAIVEGMDTHIRCISDKAARIVKLVSEAGANSEDGSGGDTNAASSRALPAVNLVKAAADVGRRPISSENHIPTNHIPAKETGGALGKGERRVLTAIAQYDEGVERDQLTVLTGYKRSSRDTYIQRLLASGYIQIFGSVLRASDAGIAALGPDFEPLPTGAALREYWFERLTGGEKTIFETLIEAPGWMPREQLDERTPYKRSSRDTYLNRLVARRLVETRRGEVRASERLF